MVDVVLEHHVDGNSFSAEVVSQALSNMPLLMPIGCSADVHCYCEERTQGYFVRSQGTPRPPLTGTGGG